MRIVRSWLGGACALALLFCVADASAGESTAKISLRSNVRASHSFPSALTKHRLAPLLVLYSPFYRLSFDQTDPWGYEDLAVAPVTKRHPLDLIDPWSGAPIAQRPSVHLLLDGSDPWTP